MKKSSSNRTPNFCKRFIAIDRRNPARSDFIAAPNCLSSPKASNLVRLAQVQTLDKPIRQQRPRFRR